MRLFHVSEESNIEVFKPRLPKREDLDNSVGLVWAINEKCLPNFLTPRNCPRVTYHIGEDTTPQDIASYMSSDTTSHVVILEHKWFEMMKKTTLYLYEFDVKDFYLQDDQAGYYVAETEQIPTRKYVLDDLFFELFSRNVELRFVDNLWSMAEKIKQTSFKWSMCRMGFADKKNLP